MCCWVYGFIFFSRNHRRSSNIIEYRRISSQTIVGRTGRRIVRMRIPCNFDSLNPLALGFLCVRRAWWPSARTVRHFPATTLLVADGSLAPFGHSALCTPHSAFHRHAPPIKSQVPKIRMSVGNVTVRFLPYFCIFPEWEHPLHQIFANPFATNLKSTDYKRRARPKIAKNFKNIGKLKDF